MREKLIVILALIFCSSLLAPTGADAFGNAGRSPAKARHRSFSGAEIEKMSKATALIRTSMGEIRLKFFPEVAPNHVNNFIELAKSGFYDRTAFHRVIPGFMIQGGDPESKSHRRAAHGTGGPSYSLRAEFSDRTHKRGTLSMARSADPNSAGSQFFICVADTPWLNGQYTVFGEVVSGMDVVDKIVNQPRDRRDNPLERVEVTVRIIEPKPMKKAPAPQKPLTKEKKDTAAGMGNKPATPAPAPAPAMGVTDDIQGDKKSQEMKQDKPVGEVPRQ